MNPPLICSEHGCVGEWTGEPRSQWKKTWGVVERFSTVKPGSSRKRSQHSISYLILSVIIVTTHQAKLLSPLPCHFACG